MCKAERSKRQLILWSFAFSQSIQWFNDWQGSSFYKHRIRWRFLELIKEFINCKQPIRCVNKFMPCNKIFHDYPLCQISATHNGLYFFQWNVYDDVSQNCGISSTYDNVYLIFSSYNLISRPEPRKKRLKENYITTFFYYHVHTLSPFLYSNFISFFFDTR